MHPFPLLAVLILQLMQASQGFLNSHTVPSTSKTPAISSIRGTNKRRPSSGLSMSALSVLSSGAAISAVVAIHEAGHFLAAKSFAMKIESYNVGYGPKLISVNDSEGIEYALRVIPMGGYVAFPSNVKYADRENVDEIPDDDREIIEDTDPDLLQNRPWPQRAVVVSAGVIANILLTISLSSFVAASSGVVLVSSSPNYTLFQSHIDLSFCS
jgi:RIP metalloprotease RseP